MILDMAGVQRSLSVSSLFICQRCLSNHTAVLTQQMIQGQLLKRHMGYVQRVIKQEKKKETENQYVGEHATKTRMVYAWGLSASGALGIASYLRPDVRFTSKQTVINKIKRPARVKFFDINKAKPLSIACGHGFSIFHVKHKGKKMLLGTGVNTDSQIGYHEVPKGSGRVLDQLIEPGTIRIPARKPEDLNITSMSCGRAHTVILVDGEGVFSLGNNSSGQCGRSIVDGEVYRKSQMVNKLKDLPDDIVKVVCGQDHTLFLTSTGQVWSCGLGADGQTGLGHYKVTGRPEHVKGDIQGERIVSVHAKGDLTLAVSDRGDVFGWGNSEYSQLGSITEQTQVNVPRQLPTHQCGHVIKAVAGGAMCALLNSEGQVFVWGYGLLGKGPKLEVTAEPTPLPAPLFGKTELSPKTKVVDIDCGITYMVAKTDIGDLYSWGRNNKGCLGLNIDKNQLFPWRISLPAEAVDFSCGPDHMVTICKSFT